MQDTEKEPLEANDQVNKGEETAHVTEEQMAHGLNVDENLSGTQLLDDSVSEDELERLKEEAAAAKDKYLRLAAEFDNYRRRSAKERLELVATAGKDVIAALLDVLDDSERAARQIESAADLNTEKEGIMLVFNKLRHVLQQKGLKPMDANGVPFDPELHDAITEIPAPSEALKGKVVDVIQPGYYLNDKLIRHAKVVVGK